MKQCLIISSEFPPQPGGIGNHAWNLAKALKNKGYAIQVVTNSRSPAEAHEEQTFDREQTFPIIRSARRKLVFRTYLDRLIKILRCIRTSRTPMVLASGKYSIWMAAIASICFPRRRYFAILHGSELGPHASSLMRFCLRRMTGLIAVSAFTAGLATRLNNRLRPTVIHNGFMIQPPGGNKPQKKWEGYPNIITVGNMSRRKGQHNLIAALPMISAKWPRAQYHLIGIPTDKKRLQLLSHSLGLADRVFFHDILDNDALYAALQAADIFAMLSEPLDNGDVEGFGIAILEANHFGLPAIGSADSGIAEAIHHGFSGLLVDQHSPTAIEMAVSEILNNHTRYQKNAKKWSESFHWPQVVNKYIEVLDS